MFVLHRLYDGNTYLLLESAANPFRVFLVQALPAKSRIDPLLDCLPKLRGFRYRQSDVVHIPKVADHAV
jgi:hypothetical protein